MLIAITQHAGAVEDESICEKYNHKAKLVSPARYHEHADEIEKFVTAANNH
jgi:uroporphyrinogen-III synthase